MEGNANDNVERNYLDPMLKVIEEIKDEGYTKEFMVKEGELREMGESNKTYDSNNLRLTNEYRFEGTSDPEYMGILYTIESSDGDKGYVTSAYGPYGDEDVANFIKKIERVEAKDGKTNKKI